MSLNSELCRTNLVEQLSEVKLGIQDLIAMVGANDSDCDILLRVVMLQAALNRIKRILIDDYLQECLSVGLISRDSETQDNTFTVIYELYEITARSTL